MKKRIVYVTYNYWPPKFGGELLLAIERFKGLAERGYEVTVLTAGCPGYPARQQDEGLMVLRSPQVGSVPAARLIRRFLYVFWVLWHLHRQTFEFYYQGDPAGVDTVTSVLGVWLFTRLARWKKARRIIVHAIADTEMHAFDPHGWTGFWRQFLFRCFDVVVAVSPALYRGLEPIFPNSARLIINAVQDDIFRPLEPLPRQRFRDLHEIAEEQVIFAFLGTVGVRKGFDLLAQAFLSLAQHYPHWHLWVIGPYATQHSQNLNAQEAQRVMNVLEPVSAQVTYWGRVDEREHLRDILSAADIFVFPSRREGMPLAPVEAMASGLPVIITRIPNITDLVCVENVTGLYVPVNDAVALKAAMEALGCQPMLRREMGKQAIERVREAFGWQAHLARWEALYQELSSK